MMSYQISGLLSMQNMLKNNETARIEDASMLNARLKALEQNQDDLRTVLGL
jgi:polyhydroxyalkanoate synthesis regulator phasin